MSAPRWTRQPWGDAPSAWVAGPAGGWRAGCYQLPGEPGWFWEVVAPGETFTAVWGWEETLAAAKLDALAALAALADWQSLDDPAAWSGSTKTPREVVL